MKTDKFTKVVLAVIAVNLTILTVKNLDIIPKAYANKPSNNEIFKPNMNYGLVPFNEDGSIDVNIKSFSSNSVMDVNIEEVGGYSTYGTVPVEIE
ncbi:MAG: hypothetical protein RH981_14150 [Arenibacter sp.]